MSANDVVKRTTWENDIQWQARRFFIEKHRGSVPLEQLDAMSMVWANMKFLGCRYPKATEEKLKMLEATCVDTLNIPTETKKRKKIGEKAIIEGFVLYVRDSSGFPENAISLLHRNAQRAHKSIEFLELEAKDDLFSCAVVIGGIQVAMGQAKTKKEAKRNCADKAVEKLRASQPVVDEILSHKKAQVIEKEELFKGKAPRISENSLGNQMLRRMGWTGGGLGLEGRGRTDPVLMNETQGRQGLGRDVTDASINKISVKNMVRNFIMDHNKKELRFSSDLSREDRGIIHSICQQHGIRHKSFGYGQDRYLVISKP